MATLPDEPPRLEPDNRQLHSIARLTSLVRRRPVAAVVVTALVTAVVTAAVIIGTMAALSGTARSPVASLSSTAPSGVVAENQVSIFLTSGVTEEQRRAIDSALRKLPSVKDFRYESRQEAYARFKEQFKDAPDLVNATKPDSLPDSFRVTLKAPSGFCEVARRLDNHPGVSAVIGPGSIRASC